MTVIAVDGEGAALSSLAGLQEQLLAAVASGEAIALDVSRVACGNIGFVQLIAAALRHACERGTTFALTAPAPAPLESVLRRAGFLSDPRGEDAAFWLQGAE